MLSYTKVGKDKMRSHGKTRRWTQIRTQTQTKSWYDSQGRSVQKQTKNVDDSEGMSVHHQTKSTDDSEGMSVQVARRPGGGHCVYHVTHQQGTPTSSANRYRANDSATRLLFTMNSTLTARTAARRNIPSLSELGRGQLQHHLKLSLSQDTWAGLRVVFNQVRRFAEMNALPLSVVTGVHYLSEISHLPRDDGGKEQLKRSYLRTWLRQWKMVVERLSLWAKDPVESRAERQLLTFLQRGLKHEGLGEATDKALPVMKATIMKNLHLLPELLQAGIWLAFKTASRWDEMTTLTRSDILYLNHSEMCIAFWRTKARQDNRADHFVIVADNQQQQLTWFRRIIAKHVPSAAHEQPIWEAWSTEAIDDYLREWPVEMHDQLQTLHSRQNIRARYTAHSIKAGALQLGIKAVAEKKITPQQLSALAKHQHPLGQIIAPMTVGYIRDAVLVARATGSADVTVLL